MPSNGRTPQTPRMAFRGRQPASEFGQHSWLTNQLVAAGGGVLDGATWGLGDRIYAGVGALADAAQGGSMGDAYAKRMAYEKARDAYYAQNFAVARTVGEIGGSLIPIPGGGPLGALARQAIGNSARFAKFAKTLTQVAKDGKRIRQVAPLIKRERVFASTLGAGTGGVGQAYSDMVNGHLSSAGDYVGAMLGGAAQAQMALHLRPRSAGAIGGVTSSIAQDALSGRPISLANAAKAGAAGMLAGALGDKIGRARFYRSVSPEGQLIVHNNMTKAKIGEAGSVVRTIARGDTVASMDKRRVKLEKGSYTYPDLRTTGGKLVEAKAGVAARISKQQTHAYQQFGDTYRVDHVLPKDQGALIAFLASQAGYHVPLILDDDDR